MAVFGEMLLKNCIIQRSWYKIPEHQFAMAMVQRIVHMYEHCGYDLHLWSSPRTAFGRVIGVGSPGWCETECGENTPALTACYRTYRSEAILFLKEHIPKTHGIVCGRAIVALFSVRLVSNYTCTNKDR